MREPKQYDFAFCSNGMLGLIITEEPIEVTYEDGTKDMAWAGIHLGERREGLNWSSRNPRVLFNRDDIEEIARFYELNEQPADQGDYVHQGNNE